MVTPPCMADSMKSSARCRGVKSPKTGWTWESTSPGITVEPLASTTRSASSSSRRPSPMMTPSRARSESASTTGWAMSPLTICPMFRIRVFMRGLGARPAPSRRREVQTDRGTSARPAVLTPPHAPWAVLVGQGLSPGRRPVLPAAAGSSTILYREGAGRVSVHEPLGPGSGRSPTVSRPRARSARRRRSCTSSACHARRPRGRRRRSIARRGSRAGGSRPG